MSSVKPYQPALLRLVHGVSALLALLTLVTGFWVYNTYDRRWGSLPLPRLDSVQDIHGTLALTFFVLFPALALYSFHLGDRRLIQPQSLQHLRQPGEPRWWVALHRVTTTLMLLAATFSILTGRMMQERWLPSGDVTQQWYLAHLLGWVGVCVSLALHVLLGAKVGGVPLLRSMVQWGIRSEDSPRGWFREMHKWPSNSLLQGLEILVLGGLVLALVLPVFTLD